MVKSSLKDISDKEKVSNNIIYYENLTESAVIYGLAVRCLYGQNDGIDLGSGINQSHIDILKKKIEGIKYNITTVIFDFDRTLTQIEGCPNVDSIEDILTLIERQSSTITFFNKDIIENFDISLIDKNAIVEYQFGGITRLRMLQSVWDYLLKKNIQIIVLTNNPQINLITDLLNTANLPIEKEDVLHNTGFKYNSMAKNTKLLKYCNIVLEEKAGEVI